MRILIVSQYFWPENFRVNDVCAGLVQRGHQVDILTGIPNYPDGKFFPGYGLFRNTRQDYGGARIIRVPLYPRGKGGNLNLILNYLSFVLFGSLYALFLCRGKYDAIFVYAISPILMAIPAIVLKKVRKAPIFLYILDLWPESISAVGAIKSPFILKLVEGVVRFIYKHSDRILVSSPGFTDRVKELCDGRDGILYWPQWAEDTYKLVAPDENSVEGREMPAGFRVMFAGNVGAAQGFKTIIEAAEKLKKYTDIQWVILGDGRMKPWVEEQVRSRKLGDTVRLLGKRPVETMPAYFSLADVMLVTLKKDPIFALTIPAKFQSYMACGRPILACLDGEGAKVLQEAGAGLSCAAEAPEALAECVLKMSRLSAEERKEMGLKGRAYFEKYFARGILLTQLEKWMASMKKADK